MNKTGVLLVMLVLMNISTAFADTSSSAADELANDPCHNDSKQRWWDNAHQQLSSIVCWPSRWFDDFFGHGDNLDSQAGTTLRIRQSATLRDDHDHSAPLHIHTHVLLPQLKNRVKLIFSNDDEAEDDQQRIVGPGQRAADSEPHGFRAALRWMLVTTKNNGLDFDVGMRSGLKAYGRARHRWIQPLSDRSRLYLTQKLTYRQTKGLSYQPTVDYSYALSKKRSIGLGIDAKISEETIDDGKGWIINPWASYYQRLSQKSALRYAMGLNAETRPAWGVTLYRTSILYRRSFYRRWLFYEIEPFLEWPRSQHFGTVSGISVRLEVYLGFLRSGKNNL